MASYAAQLVDLLYGLVERVTGYGARGEDDKGIEGAQDEPSKVPFAVTSRTQEVIEIRSRSLPESGGSGAQVN
ncbi:unnamed protein product [Alopecurus aequalis]